MPHLYNDTIVIDQPNLVRLITSLAVYRGGPDDIDAEAEVIYHWAKAVALEYELLDMVLNGDVLIGVRDFNVVFSTPTPEQKVRFEQLTAPACQDD